RARRKPHLTPTKTGRNRKKSFRFWKPDETRTKNRKPDGNRMLPGCGQLLRARCFARHARSAVTKSLHASHFAGSSGDVSPRAFASATLTLCRALRPLRNFPGVRLSGGFSP